MTRMAQPALLVLTILIAAAVTANASPTRSIEYLKVGETADGQPVYLAIIQLNYMDAALAAELFGGQAVPGQNVMIYRGAGSGNYDSTNGRRAYGSNTGRYYGSDDTRIGRSNRYQSQQ